MPLRRNGQFSSLPPSLPPLSLADLPLLVTPPRRFAFIHRRSAARSCAIVDVSRTRTRAGLHSAGFGGCRLASPAVFALSTFSPERTRDVKVTRAPQRLRRRWNVTQTRARELARFSVLRRWQISSAPPWRTRRGRYRGCARTARTPNYRSSTRGAGRPGAPSPRARNRRI